MIREAEVVQRARRRICRAMRSRPPNFRACMPFDPSDVQDVEAWVAGHLHERKWSGDESIAYAVQWILWEAAKACRQRNHAPTECSLDRETGSLPVRSKLSRMEAASEFENIEELLACMVSAIAAVISLNHRHTVRRSEAALSCVARVVHAATTVFSPTSLRRFKLELANSVLNQMRISPASREKFCQAMTELRATGNIREDLKAVGWSSPGAEQWSAFKNVLFLEFEKRGFVFVRSSLSAERKQDE